MGVARRRMRGPAIVRLYPSVWRARYAVEMTAVLRERPVTWRDTVDLMRGALDAHLHPDQPSRLPSLAALLAGAAWTIVALAVLAEPVPPDRPGFLSWTLVPGLVGAVAGLVAALGMSLRLGDAPGHFGRAATIAVALTGGCWVGALALASVGGAYGVATAAIGALAAVALVALGCALIGRSEPVRGIALVVVGGAFVLPVPAAWVTAAAAWTAVGIWEAMQRAGSGDRRVPS
jgi:hypothetical protein